MRTVVSLPPLPVVMTIFPPPGTVVAPVIATEPGTSVMPGSASKSVIATLYAAAVGDGSATRTVYRTLRPSTGAADLSIASSGSTISTSTVSSSVPSP